jgi:peptide/nickel transport system permease protein
VSIPLRFRGRRFRIPLSAAVGTLALTLLVVLGIVIPILSPYGITEFSDRAFGSPTLQHPFGTDQFGRDIMTRAFAAVPLDLGLAALGVVIPFVLGTLVGAAIGTTRIIAVEWIWTAVIEGINAFPGLILLIAIVSVVGLGVQGVLVSITLVGWARYARIARARALVVSNAEFVQATRILGYSRRRVLFKHVVPNIYQETAAYALSDLPLVILSVAGLSFLGLGIRPPAPEWGYMLYESREFLSRAWWMAIIPGAMLSITAASVSLIAIAHAQADD